MEIQTPFTVIKGRADTLFTHIAKDFSLENALEATFHEDKNIRCFTPVKQGLIKHRNFETTRKMSHLTEGFKHDELPMYSYDEYASGAELAVLKDKLLTISSTYLAYRKTILDMFSDPAQSWRLFKTTNRIDMSRITQMLEKVGIWLALIFEETECLMTFHSLRGIKHDNISFTLCMIPNVNWDSRSIAQDVQPILLSSGTGPNGSTAYYCVGILTMCRTYVTVFNFGGVMIRGNAIVQRKAGSILPIEDNIQSRTASLFNEGSPTLLQVKDESKPQKFKKAQLAKQTKKPVHPKSSKIIETPTTNAQQNPQSRERVSKPQPEHSPIDDTSRYEQETSEQSLNSDMSDEEVTLLCNEELP